MKAAIGIDLFGALRSSVLVKINEYEQGRSVALISLRGFIKW